MIDAANVPDAVFGLDFVEKRTRYYYMLEADRATMPVYPQHLFKNVAVRKISDLLSRAQGGFHTQTYNIPSFRVLTCTTTPERARNIVAMIKKNIAPSNMFLVSDVRTLQNTRDVLALGWITGKGEIVRLAFIDMACAVRGDQAVLLARAPAVGRVGVDRRRIDATRDKHPARPLASDDDRSWVYCRFVIPLEQPAREEERDSRPTLGPSPLPRSQ